jgi:hypothetical protein
MPVRKQVFVKRLERRSGGLVFEMLQRIGSDLFLPRGRAIGSACSSDTGHVLLTSNVIRICSFAGRQAQDGAVPEPGIHRGKGCYVCCRSSGSRRRCRRRRQQLRPAPQCRVLTVHCLAQIDGARVIRGCFRVVGHGRVEKRRIPNIGDVHERLRRSADAQPHARRGGCSGDGGGLLRRC